MGCLRTVQVTLPRAESRLQEGSLMCCCMRKLSLTNIRGILASSSTARRSRKQQGWSLQLTVYCLLISDAKKRVATLSRTWFSATSARSPYNLIVAGASEWRTNPQSASRNRSIHSMFMCGGESVDVVPPGFVSLMASWMLISTQCSWDDARSIY